MARSRNIKPGFFTNEELVELPFATRLLFAGLWTLADKEGRLKDRPKTVKMKLFPADDLDVEEMLAELAGAGLIRRYEAAGERYVCIPSWDKHQNPHHTEKASEIPPPDGGLTVKETLEPESPPVTAVLIPDSGFLIPDSLDVPPSAEKAKRAKPKTKYPEDFTPDETGVAACTRAGLNQAEELGKFRNHHEARGTLMANWQAGFRTWLDKAVEFRRGKARGDNRSTTVPGPVGKDPALAKLDADAKTTKPMSAEQKAALAELTQRFKLAA
jgi:hypothetical protein